MHRGWLKICAAVAAVICLAVAIGWFLRAGRSRPPASAPTAPVSITEQDQLAGSQSCRECHEPFYKLWSTSHHGLAMQPFTAAFAREQLTGPPGETKALGAVYRTEISAEKANVVEIGPGGEKRYPIRHVMGGKNVYYFLTPLERGRLQVLPLAYDVRKRVWFDTQASALRHFRETSADVLPWRDPSYTFNTSCYNCHVSQLSKNYDLASDTYRTTWAEPGINCETCHGGAAEHIRLARQLPRGAKMPNVGLIVTRTFSPEQLNALCAPCHAKMSPISSNFRPGDRYFDHYDLSTLEDADFYPDGRDLGENYTYTSWRMSPCAISGQLSCMHCHTSSGRYRFKDQNPNGACLPCHEKNVKDGAAHTRHKPDGEGGRCIACHMPMSGFARMNRSDHSMRPPMPAATIAFKSPNACNSCHSDKDAAWADQLVRQWHARDYQALPLHRAKLLSAARQRDWSRLPEMLEQIIGAQRDEVYATSFIRLLGSCDDERKWPGLRQAMSDQSPLVRSAAALALGGMISPENRSALLSALADGYRLVRIRAAGALAGYPRDLLNQGDQKRLESAWGELLASLAARPDDWSSHYNLGSYWSDQNELARSVAEYEIAHKLRPDVVPPLVNISMVHARMGQPQRAREALAKALALEPSNAAAHYNLGLLEAELGNKSAAEEHLRAAIKSDPLLADAVYNLGVLLAEDKAGESLELLRRAYDMRRGDAKFGYTLAFYLNRAGSEPSAAGVLREIISKQPNIDAYMLLGAIHEKRGRLDDARAVYREAASNQRLAPPERRAATNKLMDLQGR